MPASLPPDPRLGKSQALNISQGTVSRLAALIPNVATEVSPVTIYQPDSGGLSVGLVPSNTLAPIDITTTYGVWVAPDANGDGSTWYATVECFGGGGGAGAGNHTQGGGGGGGGEYACETQYPIEPGASYIWVAGLPGAGGLNNSTGMGGIGTEGVNGGTTIFDLAGIGLAGGVVASGGQGGDQTAVGIGGSGGTGSQNSIHFDGGDGGTNVSGNGSDNPVSLAETSGMFVGNTLNPSVIHSWLIMNDNTGGTRTVNDATLQGQNGTITNLLTGGLAPGRLIAPAQTPAYNSTSGTYGPNPTIADACFQWQLINPAKPSAKIVTTAFGFSGAELTISCWLQCDPSGTWGQTANGSIGVVAANTQHYGNSAQKGYGLYFLQVGPSSAPAWQLHATVGDGVHVETAVSSGLPPVPGTWYYCVMRYNAGTLSLYINNVLAQSAVSSGFSSVPGGGFAHTIGIDPGSSANWFFGYISNLWWAADCITTTGMTQAFGLSPATGGAGGGASGGPSANGGNGSTAGGATGGAGGVPATQPASLVNVSTAACGGFAGANANNGNASPLTPAGGPYGGGGGASGDMTSPPTLSTLVIPFTSAVTYAGVDALSAPDAPYSTSQQNNPASGQNSLLFAGGLASDSASGSKNTLLLLPPGLAKTLGGPGGLYTIQNVFLTFTNANTTAVNETVMEVGYTTDTTLPQTYGGASLVDYIGAIPIPAGAGTITYDLSASNFMDNLTGQGGATVATALLLGPAANPTWDGYASQTGPDFYAAIFGPGAADTSGNNEYPYLTIVYENTLTVQQGSSGLAGGILITQVVTDSTPIAFVEPFAGTDDNGNKFAQGFTGPIVPFDPSVVTPGHYIPETWHQVTSFSSSWAASGNGAVSNGFWLRLNSDGFVEAVFDLKNTTSTADGSVVISAGVIPSAYYPGAPMNTNGIAQYGTVPTTRGLAPYLEVDANGQIKFHSFGMSATANINISGYVRWWPGNL